MAQNKTSETELMKPKAAACLLSYGFNIKTTAQLLGLSASTLYKWRRAGTLPKASAGKPTKEANKTISGSMPAALPPTDETTGTNMLWQLINHQLERLTHQASEQEANLRKTDIDILYRLYSLAKERQQGWGRVVNVLRRFMLFAENHDRRLALKILPLAEVFLAQEREQYQNEPTQPQ